MTPGSLALRKSRICKAFVAEAKSLFTRDINWTRFQQRSKTRIGEILSKSRSSDFRSWTYPDGPVVRSFIGGGIASSSPELGLTEMV